MVRYSIIYDVLMLVVVIKSYFRLMLRLLKFMKLFTGIKFKPYNLRFGLIPVKNLAMSFSDMVKTPSCLGKHSKPFVPAVNWRSLTGVPDSQKTESLAKGKYVKTGLWRSDTQTLHVFISLNSVAAEEAVRIIHCLNQLKRYFRSFH